MRGTAATLIGVVLALGLLVPACTGGSDGEVATPAEPRKSATAEEEKHAAPLPPSDFTAKPGAFQVVLSWSPASGGSAERLVIYRNTSRVASLPASATTYTDTRVIPGEEYAYEIEAQAEAAVSDRVLATAETTLPPLRAARVAGSFDVRMRTLSSTGYGEYPAPNFGWQLRPRCVEGPCAVVLSDLHLKPVHATLRRQGAKYRGSYDGRFTIECAGTPVSSSVTVELRVDAARVIDREWRASRLVGTLGQSEAEQLGCRYSEARFSVRARLVQ